MGYPISHRTKLSQTMQTTYERKAYDIIRTHIYMDDRYDMLYPDSVDIKAAALASVVDANSKLRNGLLNFTNGDIWAWYDMVPPIGWSMVTEEHFDMLNRYDWRRLWPLATDRGFLVDCDNHEGYTIPPWSSWIQGNEVFKGQLA